MWRSAVPSRSARLSARRWATAAGPVALAAAVAGCAARPRCDGLSCAAACPRDSVRDAAGRCACVPGDVLVLGACVPPSVGDAFCGPAARMSDDGCAFRPCADGEELDVASGTCVLRASLAHGGAIACSEGARPLLENGQAACVPPDATCPRGARRVGDSCLRPARCPAGSLPDGTGCRAVVTTGGRSTGRRVDVGAWTALALGTDGGPGSSELCRPVVQRPGAFGLAPGRELTLGIRVAMAIPDQDVSRVHARVELDEATGRLRPPPAVQALLSDAVETLLEPLRGLGGESSAAAVEVDVRCTVGTRSGAGGAGGSGPTGADADRGQDGGAGDAGGADDAEGHDGDGAAGDAARGGAAGRR